MKASSALQSSQPHRLVGRSLTRRVQRISQLCALKHRDPERCSMAKRRAPPRQKNRLPIAGVEIGFDHVSRTTRVDHEARVARSLLRITHECMSVRHRDTYHQRRAANGASRHVAPQRRYLRKHFEILDTHSLDARDFALSIVAVGDEATLSSRCLVGLLAQHALR